MSSGLAARLPLVFSDNFGPYDLITDYEALATQNLKMLVLTNPGERMMYVNFGVGLKSFLFEQNAPSTYGDIDSRIREQAALYLPFLEIGKIDFSVPESNPDLFPNKISIKIHFRVIPLQIKTSLNIEVDNNIN